MIDEIAGGKIKVLAGEEMSIFFKILISYIIIVIVLMVLAGLMKKPELVLHIAPLLVLAFYALIIWGIVKLFKHKIKPLIKERQLRLKKERENITEEKRNGQIEIEKLLGFSSQGLDLDHKAMYKLAKYYYEGNKIEQNYVESMYWIYQAEALGNPNAPDLRKSIERKASNIQLKAAQEKLSEKFKDIVVVKDEKIDLIKVKDYLLKKFK